MKTFIITLFALFLSSLSATADQSGSMFSREIRAQAQEALTYYGFDAGPADGLFGRRTVTAIEAWQAASGATPTGTFSRASLGNLLQQYRADLARRAAVVPEIGLPTPVIAALSDMGSSCGASAETLSSQTGVVQRVDLNGDDVDDYLLDGSAADCFGLCGAASCQVTAVVSNTSGYRRNDFLGYSVTPQTFVCQPDGRCAFAR